MASFWWVVFIFLVVKCWRPDKQRIFQKQENQKHKTDSDLTYCTLFFALQNRSKYEFGYTIDKIHSWLRPNKDRIQQNDTQ